MVGTIGDIYLTILSLYAPNEEDPILFFKRLPQNTEPLDICTGSDVGEVSTAQKKEYCLKAGVNCPCLVPDARIYFSWCASLFFTIWDKESRHKDDDGSIFSRTLPHVIQVPLHTIDIT